MMDYSELTVNRILKEILSKTTSDDLATRQEAILELALLIEKHSPRRDKQSYYESMLPPELLNMSLTEDEQTELVHEVGRIVLSDNVTGSLVWALSKSSSLDALEYLLGYVCGEPSPNDEHGIWQALLRIHIFLYQDHPLHNQVLDLGQRYNLQKVLEQIEKHCGEDVRKTIQGIRQRLDPRSNLCGQSPDEPPGDSQRD